MDYTVPAAEELKTLRNKRISEKAIRRQVVEIEALLRTCEETYPPGERKDMRCKILSSNLDSEKERLEKVSKEIRRIEGALEALDEDETKILCMSYVEHRSMEDIAMKEHISRATAFRKRERALENFTRALFGVVRS